MSIKDFNNAAWVNPAGHITDELVNVSQELSECLKNGEIMASKVKEFAQRLEAIHDDVTHICECEDTNIVFFGYPCTSDEVKKEWEEHGKELDAKLAEL